MPTVTWCPGEGKEAEGEGYPVRLASGVGERRGWRRKGVERGVLFPRQDECTPFPSLPPEDRTGYAMSGTLLVVTQEDFLVIFLCRGIYLLILQLYSFEALLTQQNRQIQISSFYNNVK